MAPQVQIYFGSQTGTAECFSEEIAEEAKEQGIECEVLDLLTFQPETFAPKKIVILVVSTYGEGEPSDNAVQFHKWVMDPRNDGGLKGQRFCVMGLGDMNYSKFNNMGLMTDQNLERMGGKRIYRRGVGDDSQDIHADFQEWKGGGLWEALKNAIADVMEETGGAGFTTVNTGGAAAQVAALKVVKKPELHVFYGHEEADGAAKDICESVVASLKEQGMVVPIVQDLKDRKSVEVVRKLPRKAVAVVIADCNQEGLCSSGRKLVRNMNLELDSGAMGDKSLSLAFLAVASSKCNNSASALRDQMEKSAQTIPKAFDRAGIFPLKEKLPQYLDAGVDSVEPVIKELTSGLVRYVAAAVEEAAPEANGAAPAAAAAVESAKKTLILCAGDEAREAGEALAGAWPGGNASVEDASLAVLASAAKERAQVVLAVECAVDGALSDAGRGLAAQLGAAPIAIRASLRQVRFAMLSIAGTHYGNAGERASANAMLEELTRAAAPVMQALQKFGAACVANTSVDLQETDGEGLTALCGTLQKGFSAGATAAVAAAAATNGYPAAAAPAAPAAATSEPVLSTKLELKMGASAGALPAEVPGEPSDVLARFYFDADQTKVAKVRELRQQPDQAQGLSTAEVEFEAVGRLKEYTLGGTFSLLPENDPADVAAAVRLMGLSETNLGQYITFVPADGGSKIKRPFPTPCTLKDALSRYCDLGRAPTKKMLQALQSKLDSQEAKDYVSKLLADAESMKVLQSAALCCKMHEFWSMIGVKKISPVDFLLNCPRQKAREFTIASSPKATPQRITLCVSLTSHELPNMEAACKKLIDAGCLPSSAASILAGRARFFGTCSQWLTSKMRSGDTILAKQRPSPLHLPGKDVPVIMVGSGAGVAPFRGFWEELRRGSGTAPAALFFGCRNADQDWLFKEEMNGAVKLTAGCGALARMQVGPKRPLTCLFTAFSRPGEGKTGKYVQDDVKAQSTSVKHWIEKMSGYVYICGSTAMGNGVLDALAETLEGGRETVDALRKEGRIVAEMWG